MNRPENSLLKANLQALSPKSPALVQTIENAEPAGDFSLIPTRSRRDGKPVKTVCYQGHTLHSRFDPLREARRLIERSGVPQNGCLIALGFGLGYHLDEFRRQYPESPLIAADPDPSVLRAVFQTRDLTGLLAAPSFHLFCSPEREEIIPLLEQYYGRPYHLLKLRSAAALHPEYYAGLEKRINTYISRKEVNHNTLNRFGSLWMRNLTRNIPRFAGAPGIKVLENSLQGIPSLILAAGPSLERLRGRLADLSRRMTIVAVDTACRFCREEGVDPHFVVVVDPQYWNSRHLDYCSLRNSLLITESSVFPGVLERDFAAAYFGQSLFPLGRILESVLADRGRLGAGGSVTTSAWDFARYLGTGPLYMAGLDLGYPNHQTHCRGSFFEERAHWLSGRTAPAETASFSYLYRDHPYPAAAAGGGKTLSDDRLQVYQWWFEDRMTEYPELSTYTLAPEGTAIEGMPLASLEELHQLPLLTEETLARLQALRSPRSRPAKGHALWEQADRVLQAMENLAQKAEAAEGITASLLEAAKEASPETDRGMNRGFQRLAALDEAMMRISFREVAEFLLQPFLYEFLQQRGGSRREVLESSRGLYRKIRSSASFHASLLRQNKKK